MTNDQEKKPVARKFELGEKRTLVLQGQSTEGRVQSEKNSGLSTLPSGLSPLASALSFEATFVRRERPDWGEARYFKLQIENCELRIDEGKVFDKEIHNPQSTIHIQLNGGAAADDEARLEAIVEDFLAGDDLPAVGSIANRLVTAKAAVAVAGQSQIANPAEALP